MNKLLSEIVRGYWMISDEAAEASRELAVSILRGLQFDEKVKSYNLQFFDVNQEAIGISTWSDEPTNISKLPEGTIAIVPINGVLTKYDNCGAYGLQSLAALIVQLADSPNISAIIQMYDTPGGSADGSFDLAQATVYAKSKKPVIAYADGLMASAGYRGAVAADMIVAKPGSIVGSIGTMFSIRINRNPNIQDVTVYADQSSEKNQAFEKLVNEGDATLIKETLLNPMNEIFLKEVRAARPQIDEAALKGATYIGKEAKKMGLIDKEGTLQTAILEAQKMVKQKAKISTQNSNMKNLFIEKFPSISSFLGLKKEEVENKETLTAEEIASLEGLAGNNIRLSAEVTAKETEINNLKTQIQTLTAERDNLQAKVTEYGSQSGSMGAQTIQQDGTAKSKHDFSHIKNEQHRQWMEKYWNKGSVSEEEAENK